MRLRNMLAALLVASAAVGLVGSTATRAAWDDVTGFGSSRFNTARTIGFRRAAYVVLPSGTDPATTRRCRSSYPRTDVE